MGTVAWGEPLVSVTADTQANSLKANGGPARIRTWDQRIMSPLLYR